MPEDLGGLAVDVLSGDLKGRWIECLVKPMGRGRLSMPPVASFGGVLTSSSGGRGVGWGAWLISVSV